VSERRKMFGARLTLATLIAVWTVSLWAAANGSISGTIKDPSGAVIPGATITLTNTTLKSEFKATSDEQGFYSFPTLPVGHYDMCVQAIGFKTEKKTDVPVDTDVALKLDMIIQLGEQTETVLVQAATTQIDTAATHLGDVVTGSQMTALPLNGRSFTDLLPIQPGIIPVTTMLPNSVIMAGVTGSLAPSGDLNPGNLSIDGQRESSNGFMVNGIDVQEHINGGTSIVPNLDSIDEFRVMTNNFDPEYGNYNGGMVTVISKSGSDAFHGSGFEFLRNTDLDAREYFDPNRAAYRQNQFGGTLGGPIKKQKVYFFGDYQGTRLTEGIATGLLTVPSDEERTGNFSNVAASLSGKVSGTYLASLWSQKLGYRVSSGEQYYANGCVSEASCVFPGAVIPHSAWSAPALDLLQYIPTPNTGTNQFSTSASPETVRDDKSSWRIDANSRWGQLAIYYFFDNYRVDNPYPQQQGGASVPGFNALTYGQAQLLSFGDAKEFGSGTVNDFHIGLLRNANVIGQPDGGLGVPLASQGFAAPPNGIVVQAPQFEGVENIAFPYFVMGVPITNETQNNNTLYFSDSFSKVIGAHIEIWRPISLGPGERASQRHV
jgi:Carboxypeptidase regulatory-like domain